MTDIVSFLIGLAVVLAAAYLGMLTERHRNLARNAAYAECVECPHKTRPEPLGAAHRAALDHKKAAGHKVMVVKA